MRAIDYFDRGHDRDPQRLAIVDTETGLKLTFAETKALSERIAAALQKGGFENQDCLGLYGPNDGMLLVVLLAMWRANGKWIPVNTRNAIDANAAYINYVRLKWLVYHSSKADEVQQLKDLCPTLQHFVCLDQRMGNDPSLDEFMAGVSEADFVEPEIDAFGNLMDMVGIFPTGGTTGPSKGANVTNLGWGTMIETAAGLDAVADICGVPGLAGVYVGPADLAISLGDEVVKATSRPKVRDAIVRIQQAAAAAGVVAGIHAGDGVTGKELAALGFQMITLAPESQALRRGAIAHLAEAEGRA